MNYEEIDKTVIKKHKIAEEQSDYHYWRKQSPQARLAALERIRSEYNNWKYRDKQGFQRVYRIIKQK